MFKFLIITFLILYIISKVGGYIMRTLFSGFVKQNQQNFQGQARQDQQRQPADGTVHIDYNPKGKQPKKGENFKGGDYVKFEEMDEKE